MAARAAELKSLAKEHAELRGRAVELTGLQTRKDELKKLVLRAEALATSIAFLPPEALSDLGAVGNIRAVSARIETLAGHFGRDVTSVLKPKALEALKLMELLGQIEARILSAWKGHLLGGETGAEGDSVLGHYAAYQAAAIELSSLGRQLREIANALPMDAGTVARARKLQSKIRAERLAVATSEGLSDEVIDFLRRALDGVSMTEVLDSPQILAWLREKKHAAGFRVRGS